MDTEHRHLSTQESLDIITEMINRAKGKVRENSVYFLLWGAVIAIANLGMYTLIQANYKHPYAIWLLTVPAWIFTIYLGYKHGKKTSVKSHLDQISIWLWFSFGIVIFTLVCFGEMINYQLNPVILLISALPTVVSGVIIKFRPLIFGGITFWVLGILSFLVPDPFQYLVGSLAMVLGYIIPGIMLRSKKDND